MFKRRLGRILATLAVAGLGVLGMPGPASADGPTLSYSAVCGGVKISVEGAKGIQVLRDDVTIGTTSEAVSFWGAAPGDVISVAGFEKTFTYDNPEGCDFPKVRFSLVLGCQTLITLHASLSGDKSLEGFAWETNDGGKQLEPFPAGESEQNLDSDGPFALVLPREEADIVWLSGAYQPPDDCNPVSVNVKFTDSCGKMKLDITSSIGPLQGAIVAKNGTLSDIAFFSASSPFSKTYDASPGDKFEVYYPVSSDNPDVALRLKEGTVVNPAETSFLKLAEHVHTPPVCGGLPVTGMKVGTFALGGLLLIAAGAALYVISRRRRVVSA